MNRKKLITVLLALSALLISSLACAQAGEILTPAEATQKAEDLLAGQTGEDVVIAEGAEFAPGDTAILTSEGHLVGMYQEAGGRTAFSFATRGDEVTIVGSMEVEGEIWYRIESTAGNGWLPGFNVEAQ